MMRCTSFFQQRNAGWSETWYLDAEPAFDVCFLSLQAVNAKRLALLGNDGELIGTRVSQVKKNGLSRVKFLANMAGQSLTDSDTPFMALLFRVATAGNVTRSVLLRGTPDARVVNGVYNPSSGYQSAIGAYFKELKDQGFGLRIFDRSQIPQNVISVDGTGLVTTTLAHTYSKDDRVKFVRTRDTDNKAVSKQYIIGSVPTTSTFTMIKWETGRTIVGGQVQRFIPIHSALAFYPGTTEPFIGPIRVVSRRVGRVFNSPVGRRRRRS